MNSLRSGLLATGVCAFAGCSLAHGQWTFINMNPPEAQGSGIGSTTATTQGGGIRLNNSLISVPAIWNGTASSWRTLADVPGGVRGLWNDTQVGSVVIDSVTRASMWRGTAASRVDLHPSSSTFSQALAIAGDQQVGNAVISSNAHASLWRGTAASWVDLHPQGAVMSEANATDGQHQGGYIYLGTPNSSEHAALWSGSAASFVDMNPFGPTTGTSVIYGMAPGQQVGWATSGTWGPALHASIWSGSAASWIDVNPYPDLPSQLFGTNGRAQVGRAGVPGATLDHAGLWFGSAESFIDLHQFLPAEYNRSIAWSVAELPGGGLIVGGQATRPNNTGGACIWVLAPAPGVMPLLWAAGVVGMRRRRV